MTIMDEVQYVTARCAMASKLKGTKVRAQGRGWINKNDFIRAWPDVFVVDVCRYIIIGAEVTAAKDFTYIRI